MADAALLMSVISRPDSRDWTALSPEELDWDVSHLPEMAGLRVGLHLDAGCGMPVLPQVCDAVEAVAAVFEAAGATVKPVEPFLTPQLLDDLDTFWRVRSWNDYLALSPEGRQRVLPFIRRWIARAETTSGARVLSCYHGIMDIQRATVAATAGFDVVLSPVAPVVAFPAEWPMPFGDVDSPDHGMAHIGFTAPYNMSGQPAATVNCGFTPDRKPIGVQLAGRRFDDIGVLRAVAWYEANRPPSAVPHWPIGPNRA